jgi:hypothetical protein
MKSSMLHLPRTAVMSPSLRAAKDSQTGFQQLADRLTSGRPLAALSPRIRARVAPTAAAFGSRKATSVTAKQSSPRVRRESRWLVKCGIS